MNASVSPPFLFRKPVSQLEIGKWKINLLQDEEVLQQDVAEYLTNYIHARWRPVARKLSYPHLWAGLSRFKIPAPIIRLDMAPVKSPRGAEYSVYEFELRPGGIGLLLQFFPEAKDILFRSLSGVDCAGFVNVGDVILDDAIAADILGFPYHTTLPSEKGKLYWFRHETHERNREYTEEELSSMERVSLVAIRSDGFKGDLVALGLASEAPPLVMEPDGRLVLPMGDLFKSFSYAAKPKRATWATDTFMHHHGHDNDTLRSIRADITKLIKELGPKNVIIQPYIQPREVDGYNEMWRVYFAFVDGQYIPVGGMVFGSPGDRVHGTSDSYIYPLRLA